MVAENKCWPKGHAFQRVTWSSTVIMAGFSSLSLPDFAPPSALPVAHQVAGRAGRRGELPGAS